MQSDIDKFYREVADRIKTERLKTKTTQEDLGDYLELSRASVINLEKGRHRPSVYQLVMIAKYLKIDYTALIPFRTEKSANRNSLELQKDLSNAITDQEELDKSSKTILLDFLSSVESTEEK